MEELKFCRICFSTNGKLYDMEKYNIITLYRSLSEIIVTENQQHVCSFCHALLRKFSEFKQKCITAQNLLHYTLTQNNDVLSKEILDNARKTHNIGLPYTFVQCQEIDSEILVKSEFDDSKFDLPIFDSDDEPLSKTVEERVKKVETKSRVKRKREEKHSKKQEKLQKYEETDLKLEENCVTEIKTECLFEDSFDDLNADFDCEENWCEKNNEKLYKDEFDGCFSKRILTKSEQLQEIEDRKKHDNYINSCFKCEMCYKGFISKVTYDNHMKKHNDIVYGTYICDICRLRNRSKHRLDTHKAKFHQELYTCNICFKSFKTRAVAKLHSKWHAGVEYKCQHCDMKYNALSTLQTHIRLKHASSNCCHICGASFINSNGLQLHIKRMHLGSLENGEKSPTQLDTTCSTCKLNFHTKEALQTHIETSINKQCDTNVRSCVKCGRNFSNMNKLQNHMKVHNDSAVKCGECNIVYKSGKAFQVHYKQVHLGLKHDIKKYLSKDQVCEICGNTYRTKFALINHQRSHTGERPFACELCPKRFTVQQQLQIHTRTHTGEAPYKCAHCPKSFKHRAALNRHDRVHTGIRPYLCPNCGKAFSQSNSMKMHVRTVHLKLGDPYKKRKRDSIM